MNYPEMVKVNHRHRGPIESQKDNTTIEDVEASIKILQAQFEKTSGSIRGARGKIIYWFDEVHGFRKEIIENVTSVRGGEI